jgi:deoxyribonuclease V
MILAVDTHYGARDAVTAGVWFAGWTDGVARREDVVRRAVAPEAYRPGELYRRELPPILELLGASAEQPDAVVVDGYVWLDSAGAPGLGAHLHHALGGRVAIVGVAKTAFKGSPHARRVLRGQSASPLFVTAAGLDVAAAAALVASMHGPHRLPTLLKRVDRLCRDAAATPPIPVVPVR